MRELPARDDEFISLIIVGRRRPPIWHAAAWRAAVSALDALVALTGVPGAVRTFQTVPTRENWVPFGTLKWRPQHHERWLSPESHGPAGSEARRHSSTEIWAPRWTECERQQAAPLLFVELSNPFWWKGEASAGQFNQLLHIAIPRALKLAQPDTVRVAVDQLSDAVDAVARVYRHAPWHARMYSLQHGLNNHFTYIGMWNDLVPDSACMEVEWRPWDIHQA